METKHTPGPWDIHGDYREIHQLSDENGMQTIADVDPDNLMPEQRAANAFLIAAAPDLLAALEQVLGASEDNGGMDDIDFDGIRAAIARAKGN